MVQSVQPSNMRSEPLISICLPVFNGQQFLADSIESALVQNEADFELLISDDCSNDTSREIIESFARSDKRIVFWKNEKRLGLFANYNKCLMRARGKYLKPFAQDDLWSPEVLRKQVEMLSQCENLTLATVRRRLIDEQGNEYPETMQAKDVSDFLGRGPYFTAEKVFELTFNNALLNLIGEPATVMFPRTSRGLGFQTQFRHAGDIDYWLRILRNGDLGYAPDAVAYFRKHPNAATQQNVRELWSITDLAHFAESNVDILRLMNCSEDAFIKKALSQAAKFLPPHVINAKLRIAIDSELEERDIYALRRVLQLSLSLVNELEPKPIWVERVNTQQLIANEYRISSMENIVRELLNSKSWRLTRPLREVRKLLVREQDEEEYQEDARCVAEPIRRQTSYLQHLESQKQKILRSHSWRITRIFRSVNSEETLPSTDDKRPKLVLLSPRDGISGDGTLPDGARNPPETAASVPALNFSEPSLVRAPLELKSLKHPSYWTNAGPGFEKTDRTIFEESKRLAKVIAFYLPQYHKVVENDEWWGEGFTEWRNVSKAVPRFLGHFQPRLPRDLGFYDLRTPGIMAEQASLAKQMGIFGFCFYYYFFGGKKMLREPVDNFANDSSLDFPFCLMWANESWTRRWDGGDNQILLKQDYDLHDEEELIADLARFFQNPRYIRLEGRPVFLVYRADLLPLAKETMARWRHKFATAYGEDPFIVMAQSFESIDPRSYGFDAAIEFPPHKLANNKMRPITDSLNELDSQFAGTVFNYQDLVKQSLAEIVPEFPLVRTAVPGWDNEARQPNRGITFHDSSPQIYEGWLRELIEYSRRNPVGDESFVFINAWNEWAEGAYLEPDLHWGSAYLNATARAVFGSHIPEDS